MTLEEVLIVNPNDGSGSSRRKNPKGGSKKMTSKKKNAPAGKYWVKGHTRANGTKVKGHYVSKPKRNPGNKKSAGGARTKTKTVTKYKYRNPPKPKVVYRYRQKKANPPKRRKRANPNGNNGYGTPALYKGEITLRKTARQVSMQMAIGGMAGLLAASLGPMQLSRQFNWDLTTGHKDWVASLGIALGGGMLVGRMAGPAIGAAFAIAGTAVAAVKILRTFAPGALPAPMMGGGGHPAGLGGGYQPGQPGLPAPSGLGIDLNQALANASYTGMGNVGNVYEQYGTMPQYAPPSNPARGTGNFYTVGEIHTHV